ncbi:MAG: hypothetical protein BMS9Abin05_2163 [Rhodothermia bacterium]|nr:MAG: hypothetical protein BMS9Abin05_2163 [Rhodothermia bacterium]
MHVTDPDVGLEPNRHVLLNDTPEQQTNCRYMAAHKLGAVCWLLLSVGTTGRTPSISNEYHRFQRFLLIQG